MPRDLRPIAAGVVEVARATFIFDILGADTSVCPYVVLAIVIPTERSDEGSLFHYNRKYFVNPHLFATEP